MERKQIDEKKKVLMQLEHNEKVLSKRLKDIQDLIKMIKSKKDNIK